MKRESGEFGPRPDPAANCLEALASPFLSLGLRTHVLTETGQARGSQRFVLETCFRFSHGLVY